MKWCALAGMPIARPARPAGAVLPTTGGQASWSKSRRHCSVSLAVCNENSRCSAVGATKARSRMVCSSFCKSAIILATSTVTPSAANECGVGRSGQSCILRRSDRRLPLCQGGSLAMDSVPLLMVYDALSSPRTVTTNVSLESPVLSPVRCF